MSGSRTEWASRQSSCVRSTVLDISRGKCSLNHYEKTRHAAVCSTAYIDRIDSGRGPWIPRRKPFSIAKRSSGRDPFRYGQSLPLESEGIPKDVSASFEKLPFNALVMEDD